MDDLPSAPETLFAPRSAALNAGTYRGALPPVDLAPLAGSWARRVAREKRWMYFAIATDEVLAAFAVVRLGYAANAFAFAFDRARGALVADASVLAPHVACVVGDRAGEGARARLALPGGALVQVARPAGASAYEARVRLRGIALDARIESQGAPAPLAVVAPLPGEGLANTTEKRALMDVRGEVTAGGRAYALDGALAGYDYTHGLLARRTAWRWAFGLGRARSGARVGFNFTEGFVGDRECAAWIDGELHRTRPARFAFDPARPMEPWRVRTDDGAVDLTFTPGGIHAERRDLGVIASRFIQPAGTWSGRMSVGGHDLQLDAVLGVAEDQDTLW